MRVEAAPVARIAFVEVRISRDQDTALGCRALK
jgi:hypothetical protein